MFIVGRTILDTRNGCRKSGSRLTEIGCPTQVCAFVFTVDKEGAGPSLRSFFACRFQRSPRKHANANMLRRSMSASRHCRRSCLVSSPPPDGTSLACRRRPSSAWGSRTGSRRGSRIRPIWRRGQSSACPSKKIYREGCFPLTTTISIIQLGVWGVRSRPKK